MNARPLLLSCICLLLAFDAAVSVHAQGRAFGHEQAVLPVVDSSSGQVQAWLVLEPESFHFSAPHGGGGHDLNAAFVNRLGDRFGLSFGERRSSLPVWLSRHHEHPAQGEIDVSNLTIFAQKSIGSATYVSIAGSLGKATLIPSAAAPADLGRGWNSKSLSVGGGYGSFSANIIGQIVDSPGQPRWENLGLGLTWHTPWSGQLTVGADNIITSGRNPFSPRGESRDEGTVPYVRYEQEF